MKITITSLVFSIFTSINLASAESVIARPYPKYYSTIYMIIFTSSKFIPFLIFLAIITFFYGLIMLKWGNNKNEETLKKAKKTIFYSILAIFIFIFLNACVALFLSMFGVAHAN